MAFTLHDTHGFPVELTEELARDAGVEVDRAGFDAAMAEQRERARAAAKASRAGDEAAYRALLEEEGPTPSSGGAWRTTRCRRRVVAVLERAATRRAARHGTVEIFLDRTPFYAEGGGQVGDTGTIVTESGIADVYDTVYAVPGLIAHRARVTARCLAGQDALATIDGERREAIRRNHTATHLLHSALRAVLGDHVRQQGSLVSPDYLASTSRTTRRRHARSSTRSSPGRTTPCSPTCRWRRPRPRARTPRRWGPSPSSATSTARPCAWCGPGRPRSSSAAAPMWTRWGRSARSRLLSEGSIGSNTRRIFAVTGHASLERALERERLVQSAAELLRTEPDELLAAIGRLAERQREAEKELARLRQQSSEAEARALAEAAAADGGVVVARRDEVEPDALRTLAQAVLRHDGVRAVVLGGSPDGTKVAIVAATGGTPDATQLVRTLGKMVGGGGGGSAEVATAGGKDPSGSRRRWPRRSGFCPRERRGAGARPGPGGRARSRGAAYRRGLQRQRPQFGEPVGDDRAQR